MTGPAPPFDCGSPEKAGAARVAAARALMASRAGDIDAIVKRITNV